MGISVCTLTVQSFSMRFSFSVIYKLKCHKIWFDPSKKLAYLESMLPHSIKAISSHLSSFNSILLYPEIPISPQKAFFAPFVFCVVVWYHMLSFIQGAIGIVLEVLASVDVSLIRYSVLFLSQKFWPGNFSWLLDVCQSHRYLLRHLFQPYIEW